jgi:hypothetical protein
MAKKVKAGKRLLDRLAKPKSFKDKKPKPERIIFTLDCVYCNAVKFIKHTDLIDVIKGLEENGGSLSDLKKLVK